MSFVTDLRTGSAVLAQRVLSARAFRAWQVRTPALSAARLLRSGCG
jgi:hypothetical protein